MAEDKRANPFQFPTAEEVAAAPGGREIKAARNIITRKIDGIPKRAFLLGDNDTSAVLRGTKEFVALVYQLVDAVRDVAEPDDLNHLACCVRDMMEDHRCPPAMAEVE